MQKNALLHTAIHACKDCDKYLVTLIKIIQDILVSRFIHFTTARLAQSVEHETLNLGVVGSSPTLGDQIFLNPQS